MKGECQECSGSPIINDTYGICQKCFNSMALKACIVSMAAYEDDGPGMEFLKEQSEEGQHGFGRVTLSQYGLSKFVIVQHKESNAVYVAFRGTRDMNLTDWMYNFKASLKLTGIGSFHEGSLAKADEFPLRRVAKENEGKTFVFCGHSAGGQVATIATIFMKTRMKVDASKIWCFTFGTPSVGDNDVLVHCNQEGIDKKMVHFIKEGDLVPLLLSYSQISALIDNEYSHKLVNKLSENLPPLTIALDVICLATGQQISAFSVLKDVATILNEACQKTEEWTMMQKYEWIGNIAFLTNEGSLFPVGSFHREDKEKFLNLPETMKKIKYSPKILLGHHSIINYLEALQYVCKQGLSSTVAHEPHLDKNKYVPRVTASRLTIPEVQDGSRDCQINLIIHGKNLHTASFVKKEFKCTAPFFNDEFEWKPTDANANDVEAVQIEWKCPSRPSIKASYKITLANIFHRCEVSMLNLSDESEIDAPLDMAVGRIMLLAAWNPSLETDNDRQLKGLLARMAQQSNLPQEFNTLLPDHETNNSDRDPNPGDFLKALQNYYRRPLSKDIEFDSNYMEFAIAIGFGLLASFVGIKGIFALIASLFRSMFSGRLRVSSAFQIFASVTKHLGIPVGIFTCLFGFTAIANAQCNKIQQILNKDKGTYFSTLEVLIEILASSKEVRHKMGEANMNWVEKMKTGTISDKENAFSTMWEILDEKERPQFKKSYLSQATEGSKKELFNKIEAIRSFMETRKNLKKQAFVAIIGSKDSGTYNRTTHNWRFL